MTKVVKFSEFGGPSVLKIVNENIGAPKAGEILIKVDAIGINRAEAAFRSGHYIEQANLPSGLGYEASGKILAVGAEVADFEIGDLICVIPGFSMNDYSVYGEEAIVPASAVLIRPSGLDAVKAAAIWMPYLTAYGALIDSAPLGKGDAVIITAASSSVGLAAIDLANYIGAIPIAVTRTEEKRQGLLGAGAAFVIVSNSQNLAEEVMKITEGKGAKIAFDPVAGPAAVAELSPALGVGGTLIFYGNLSGKANETPFPFGLAVGKALCFRGYLVFEIIFNPQKLSEAKNFILSGYEKGCFDPKVAKVFPFDEIVAAHEYLESNQQLGKVVVEI